MFLRVVMFFITTLLAVFAVQAEAQQGHYWNGMPSSGYGYYAWEHGSGGWDQRGNWSGDRNGRHHGQYDNNKGPMSCTNSNGVTICGSPGNH